MPFRGAFSQLFTQNTIIAGVVFGLILLGLFGALVQGAVRRRRGKGPTGKADNHRVELGYVALLACMFVFLATTGLLANAKDYPDPPKPALAVRVTGYQWCWRFTYEGKGVTVYGECQQGKFPVLVLPAGQPVRLDITSLDVLHAFWVPYFRAKLYAYPNHVNSLTITAPHPGKWVGRCAQLCGIYHYNMDFYVQAVSPAAFSKFLRTGGR
jgi:cytochrome c oxidase subunit 2